MKYRIKRSKEYPQISVYLKKYIHLDTIALVLTLGKIHHEIYN